jgi:hypothetical protein
MGWGRRSVKPLTFGWLLLYTFECVLGGLSMRADSPVKIILGGSLGGTMQPVRAVWGQCLLAEACVGAGQVAWGICSDSLVVHGKEKVYGSIP